jgi:superfamily II DNA or RNA helicase
VTVILPPLFKIDLKEEDSQVRQLAVPGWTGECTIEPFQEGRTHGFTLTPGDGMATVCLLTTGAQANPDWPYVLRMRGASIDLAAASLDLREAFWVNHPMHAPPLAGLPEYASNTTAVLSSWKNAFAYKREDREHGIEGLRPPQLGGVYATQAHWTTSKEAATIVLPTGVGKTETMLSLLVVEECARVLVVVPTDALRTQLSDKFISIGLLKTPRFAVVSGTAEYPVVGTLNHRPQNIGDVDAVFLKCNVVVTTMPLVSQCLPEVMQRMAELCTHLFIDEAHHIAAPKWKAFKDVFQERKILQFTATPFRNDDQPIGGKRIFTFSLRQAQEQGYFRHIEFVPVTEFDPSRKDKAIAEAAVARLRAESHLGHILMARVADVTRAGEVFACYAEYAEFNPVEIHTGIKSKAKREEIRKRLLSGEIRIVVCVDMLGEGFDLPELKIAAFHDIRKSLAVTLQLVGRFTRSKPNLGNATILANVADLEVKDELRKLYRHDTDWNVLLPLLNDSVSEGEFSLGEFLGGFEELPENVTLRNVRPAMSTVVFRTKCAAWSPDAFKDGIAGYNSLDKVYHTLNAQENTLVLVTTRRVSVEWAQIDEIYDWDWQLYVLHWDNEQNLLFIHNSSNSGFFKELAKAVCGDDVEQLKGPPIFRCLAGISRLKFQNVGLLEQLGRLIRYTMRAGSDVEPAMSAAQKQKAVKANLFGQGFQEGKRTTIGCSYKGRIWSYRTTNLLELRRWCREVGKRLLDASLNPDEVLEGTLIPTLVSERPKKFPLAVEWPDIFYKEPEQAFSFQIDGVTIYQHDADIVLVDPSEDGTLTFAIESGERRADLKIVLFETEDTADYRIETTSGATIRQRSRTLSLREFFEEQPPTFWFADGSSLTGIEHVALRRQPEPFPRDRIETWNWTGTNIRAESQGIDRSPETIQHRVIAELKGKGFSVLFDDDDSGESADVVGIRENDSHVDVEFWHCKFALADQPGARVKELYELCGQAQTSIRWLEKPRDLFTHLMRREPRRFKGREGTRYEVGAESDLLRIREKADSQRVLLSVIVVQPGLSKAAVSPQQLELLAVAETYLIDTFAVPLRVIGSD